MGPEEDMTSRAEATAELNNSSIPLSRQEEFSAVRDTRPKCCDA